MLVWQTRPIVFLFARLLIGPSERINLPARTGCLSMGQQRAHQSRCNLRQPLPAGSLELSPKRDLGRTPDLARAHGSPISGRSLPARGALPAGSGSLQRAPARPVQVSAQPEAAARQMRPPERARCLEVERKGADLRCSPAAR